MNKTFSSLIFSCLVSFFFVFSTPVFAGPGDIEGVVFFWKNMGLMGPGHESAHYISITRASEAMQHNIEYHEGDILQKTTLYRTDGKARHHLLDELGAAVAAWQPEYREEVLDGSSWAVVVRYTGSMESKKFKGYGKTPPDAGTLKKLILELATFETPPKIF